MPKMQVIVPTIYQKRAVTIVVTALCSFEATCPKVSAGDEVPQDVVEGMETLH